MSHELLEEKQRYENVLDVTLRESGENSKHIEAKRIWPQISWHF